MSRTMAEAQLPKRIDAVGFVENNQQLTGQIDSKKLLRFSEAVEDCNAPVSYILDFHRDQEGNRVITGSCNTMVVMTCQRCLGHVEVPVVSSFELGLVFNDDQAKQLSRQLEPAEVDEHGMLELWEVLEDEALLALPSFPVHEQGECELRQPEPAPETTDSDEKRPNPFDVLAQLKQK
ncbi:MAG: hypothetical protein CMI13_11040 [Oleibacter sp.]|nr:hypothetical protein [Thalassolituus sp.]